MADGFIDQCAPVTTEYREPINICPDVRERLRDLLFEPEMLTVGYSAFINRAVTLALAEIRAARSEAKV